MRRIAREARRNPDLRALAIRLTGDLPERQWVGEIKACHDFVRDEIRFIRDIDDVETLQTPAKTLELKAGDCDDKSILLASLLGSIGHKCRFVAIGQRPGAYEHVYVEVRSGPGWMACDPSMPWPAGRAPANARSRMVETL